MNHASRHCPFLNRTDDRCASYFNLDALGHAYRFCFDRYKTCPLYLQLLVERRMRRADAAEKTREDSHVHRSQALTVSTIRLVQLTVSAPARAHPAAVEGLPASPRL